MNDLLWRQARRLFPMVERLSREIEAARLLREQHDALSMELAAITAALRQMQAERDAARASESVLRNELDNALAERDATRASESILREELDGALAERDQAFDERDAALNQVVKVDTDVVEQLHATKKEISDRLRIPAMPQSNGSRKAVVIPVQESLSIRDLGVTLPFFEAYCQRIGVELRIIDVSPEIPPAVRRLCLQPILREYDRVALFEPDVLIREGCPDLFSLVPEGKVGAVIEGRWTDRSAVCSEISDLYGLGSLLPEERYINTGMMVIGREFVTLLGKYLQEPLIGFPTGEAELINVLLYHNDFPIHELPRDFNWVPYSPEDFDWRWAWIFQMGDYWRRLPKARHAWQISVHGERRFLSRVPLTAAHCRLPCLIEIAEQLRGNDVRVFHPAEMRYHAPAARLSLTPEGTALMWCDTTSREGPLIYGPYTPLPAGAWSVTLCGPDGENPADEAIIVDMACHQGRKILRAPGPLGARGTFDIQLEQEIPDAEIRMYASERSFGVAFIVLRPLEDHRPYALAGNRKVGP